MERLVKTIVHAKQMEVGIREGRNGLIHIGTAPAGFVFLFMCAHMEFIPIRTDLQCDARQALA